MSATFATSSVAQGIATLIDGYQGDLSGSHCRAACDLIGTVEHLPRHHDPDVCLSCGRYVWLDTDLVDVCEARSMPVLPFCLDCDRKQTNT